MLGKLSREAGESVGKYAVNQGTLTEENNPNYKITMDSVLEDFVITKRDIALEIVEGQGREYGEMTQENERYQLAVSQEYLKYLVKDVSLGINDDASIFNDAVIVSREEGEDFGSYKYSVTYEEDELSLLNYNIIEVKISDEYFIYKMTPSLSITLTGTVYYGDSIESLQYSAQATCGTEKVSGRYTMNLLHGNDSLKLTDKVVNVSFVPDSANFNSARTSISISVMPRPVTVDIYTKIAEGFGLANGAILPYIGKNYTSSDFTYVANNVIEGDELMVSLSINGDAKNVTKDGFTVSASIESELYVLANTNSVTCTITQALVTVTVENTSIKQGEEYVPTITYDGFLGGDKEKDLIEKAKVENIPTTSGYHSIIAKGAKSNNYVFIYKSGQLIIEGTKLNDNDVVINGSFSPIITMSSVTHKQGSGAFLAVSESIDKTLGNSILSPLSQQMVQVVEISTNMALSEECTYVVKLSALNSGDTVYVRTADGKVNALEYEIVDETDGVTISFKALNATGVAVYGNKGIGDVILGYWLYMAIAGVVLIIIVIIIIVKFAKRKSKKTDESYVVKGHWR